jgi:hypothetical protein
MLGKGFGPNMDEVRGEWRGLRNEEQILLLLLLLLFE